MKVANAQMLLLQLTLFQDRWTHQDDRIFVDFRGQFEAICMHASSVITFIQFRIAVIILAIKEKPASQHVVDKQIHIKIASSVRIFVNCAAKVAACGAIGPRTMHTNGPFAISEIHFSGYVDIVVPLTIDAPFGKADKPLIGVRPLCSSRLVCLRL